MQYTKNKMKIIVDLTTLINHNVYKVHKNIENIVDLLYIWWYT